MRGPQGGRELILMKGYPWMPLFQPLEPLTPSHKGHQALLVGGSVPWHSTTCVHIWQAAVCLWTWVLTNPGMRHQEVILCSSAPACICPPGTGGTCCLAQVCWPLMRQAEMPAAAADAACAAEPACPPPVVCTADHLVYQLSGD